ncbi:MAG: GNAT family N-acetyltransferase, partial [Halobacteriales archaeon]|nr:GNAT family N-acetyltransferase [Halobacteriales archaeon]
SLRATMYEGGRVRGNMLPDVLTSQLRDEAAGDPVGLRVMRIATHPAVRRRGLGSALLTRIHEEFQADVDWFGVGFGATPDLVSFWAQNGYGTVHLSTTRNDVSGEHSALMIRPATQAGTALHRRHADWFADRVPSMLSGPLRTVEVDIVRSTLRATDVTVTPDLSDRGWRLVAATAFGPGLVDVDLRPFRALVTAHLVDPADPDLLSARQERLLVRKVLQGWSWRECASSLGFHSAGECMRALGEAFVPLVEVADSAVARAEADRYRSTN